MSPTRDGCASATIATYVANDETQVKRALSPAISLSPGGLGGAKPCGKAASRSARARLSGSSSLMSIYSSAWMRLTSLPGIGTMLFATLNGGLGCFPVAGSGGPAMAAVVLVPSAGLVTVAMTGTTPPAPDDAGKSGMCGRERGRGAVVAAPRVRGKPGTAKVTRQQDQVTKSPCLLSLCAPPSPAPQSSLRGVPGSPSRPRK